LGTFGVVAALIGLGLGGSVSARSVSASVSGRPKLWGASFGNPAPWKWGPIRRFERTAGKGVSLVSFGLPFEHCHRGCRSYPFPTGLMQKIRDHGGIPVVNWSSMSIPMSIVEPRFQLRAIVHGRYDSYIKRFAKAAHRWGHPFFLRFDWEMNGNWFPWGVGVNGNHASDFVAAWRHVHHLFTKAHAYNAKWLWCPNVGHWASLYSVYPGANYVDWTCLDGYNWGTTGPNSPGASRGGFLQFNTVYGAPYQTIARHIAPHKPMMLGEVAANNHGGSESAWINRMFQELPTRYPLIQGLMWYQVQNFWDFPLHAHTAAARAFAAGIKSSRYKGSVYCKMAALTEPQIASPPPGHCKH
jgi:hypothetical protein